LRLAVGLECAERIARRCFFVFLPLLEAVYAISGRREN
jgi:hypothetical protein